MAKRVELKSLEKNTVLIASKANLVSHDGENLDIEIEFLKKIVAIEKHFCTTLAIPEKIDVSDHQVIDRLYSLLHRQSSVRLRKLLPSSLGEHKRLPLR